MSSVLNILSLLLLGITTIAFAQLALFGTVLPDIVNDIRIGYDFAGVLMAIWTLASIVSVLTVGRSVDRIDVTWFISFVMGFQSLLTLLTGFVNDVITLSTVRLLFSLTIPFVWPICAKITSMHLARLGYGYATSLYDIGSIIGLALTYILMFFAHDWRNAMVIAGAIGFIYTPIVFIALRGFVRGYTGKGGVGGKSFVGSQGSFGNRGVDGRILAILFLAFFFAMYTWTFMINWLSTYVLNDLKFGYADLVLHMLLIAVLGSIAEVLAGLYSDRIGGLRGKVSIIYIGLTTTATALLASALLRIPIIRIISITFSLIAYRIATPAFWAILNDVIPTDFIGKFGSIYNLAPSVATIASSVVSGYIIALTSSARYSVLLSAFSLVLSMMFYSLIDKLYRNPLPQ